MEGYYLLFNYIIIYVYTQVCGIIIVHVYTCHVYYMFYVSLLYSYSPLLFLVVTVDRYLQGTNILIYLFLVQIHNVPVCSLLRVLIKFYFLYFNSIIWIHVIRPIVLCPKFSTTTTVHVTRIPLAPGFKIARCFFRQRTAVHTRTTTQPSCQSAILFK